MRHVYLISVLTVLLLGCVSTAEPEEKSTADTSELPACCMATQSSKAAMILEATREDTVNAPIGMVHIPGGTYMMGGRGDQALARELPLHEVKLPHFFMDTYEVTNADWQVFVDATGYLTVAERPVVWEEIAPLLPEGTPRPSDEELSPGSMVFDPPNHTVELSDHMQWWSWVRGADWAHPLGPDSDIEGKEHHPVVHITYGDAVAYATWAGKRLPTEAEWEWAARGGLSGAIYPWGDAHVDSGDAMCNSFQGQFPHHNSLKDGYALTAEVGMYKPNGYGLYDMAGNVWELCADAYDPGFYQNSTSHGPLYSPQNPLVHQGLNAGPTSIRGGSYLCNDSYCSSYRVSARMPFEWNSSTGHVGFRCVMDVVQ